MSEMSDEKFEVKYRENSIDISKFLLNHPGGVNTLEKYEGMSIDEKFKFYQHSKAAKYLLLDYKSRNEKVYDESYLENLVDWNSGMLCQIGQLGDRYEEWVNSPVDRRIKFFDNAFYEMFTETPWYVIIIFWMPIVSAVMFIEVTSERFQGSSICILNFIFGFLLFTLIEYFLHRFLFHMRVCKSLASKLIHFMVHGIHHKTPFDDLRLVFPPAPAFLIALMLYCATHFICSFANGSINARFIMCGSIIGYLMYDLTHYYLHHSNPTSGYFYNLKRYHNYHHFVDHDLGFGVSSVFWDKVFRTENIMRDLKFRLSWSRIQGEKQNPLDKS